MKCDQSRMGPSTLLVSGRQEEGNVDGEVQSVNYDIYRMLGQGASHLQRTGRAPGSLQPRGRRHHRVPLTLELQR